MAKHLPNLRKKLANLFSASKLYVVILVLLICNQVGLFEARERVVSSFWEIWEVFEPQHAQD